MPGFCGAGASPAADASSACSVCSECAFGRTRRAGRPPQARRLPHIAFFLASALAFGATPSTEPTHDTRIRIPVWIESKPGDTPKPAFTAKLGNATAAIAEEQSPTADMVILVVLDLTGDIARVDAARAALTSEFDKLPPNAWVGLMRAQDGLRVVTDPGPDRQALATGLDSLVISGKAGFFDTVEMAGELADNVARKSNVRVALVYVTDSDIYNYRDDYTNPVINSSDPHDLSRKFADALIQAKVAQLKEALAAQQTPLFIVHLNYRYDRLNDAYENGLRDLAETTAATALFCRSPAEIPDQIAAAFATIRSAWSITLALPKKAPASLQIRLSARDADGSELRLAYRTRIALKRR